MKPHPTPETAPDIESEIASDAELVRRAVGGDEPAFAAIMGRHQARVFAVAHALLGNRADAEEITQDTFVRAYRALTRFRGDSSLSTWLHRIAVNLARNRYWYFFRRRRHATFSLDLPLGEDSSATISDLFASADPDPSQELAKTEFSELVASGMGKLERSQREILLLRSARDLPYEEIARRLRVKPGTVKSRIARAREQLRAHLAESCPEFGAGVAAPALSAQARCTPALARACA